MKQQLSVLVVTAILLISGCQPSDSGLEDRSAAVESNVLGPVSLLLVDTPGVADEIKRQWQAGHDAELSLVEVSLEEFVKNNFDVVAAHDAIIYPGSLIGELVTADKILNVPNAVWDSSEVNKKGLLQISRTRLVSYGKENWALPLGSPQLCLMYRADVLEALKALPPRTWSEFFALAETLRNLESLKDEDGNELPRDVDLPVAKGWAAYSLLAVAASRARYRGMLSTVFELDSANPLINAPPFVDALNEIKGVYGSDTNYLTPRQILQRMFGGQSAMAIGWPSIARVDSGKEVEINNQVKIIAVPGSTRWFDFETGAWKDRDEDQPINVDLIGFSGRLISVLRTTGDPNNSFEFAELVIQPNRLAGDHGSIGCKRSFSGQPSGGHLSLDRTDHKSGHRKRLCRFDCRIQPSIHLFHVSENSRIHRIYFDAGPGGWRLFAQSDKCKDRTGSGQSIVAGDHGATRTSKTKDRASDERRPLKCNAAQQAEVETAKSQSAVRVKFFLKYGFWITRFGASDTNCNLGAMRASFCPTDHPPQGPKEGHYKMG